MWKIYQFSPIFLSPRQSSAFLFPPNSQTKPKIGVCRVFLVENFRNNYSASTQLTIAYPKTFFSYKRWFSNFHFTQGTFLSFHSLLLFPFLYSSFFLVHSLHSSLQPPPPPPPASIIQLLRSTPSPRSLPIPSSHFL